MATIRIPEVDSRELDIQRIEIPFDGTIAGLLTNKSRFTLLNLSSTVDIIDVRVRLTSLVSTVDARYNFQLVAFPQGSYTDGTWKALSAEVTSKTSWAGTQALGILPDAAAELQAASPRLGATAGFGVTTASASVSGAIIPLPLAKGFDLVSLGIDVGGGHAADSLALRGALIVTVGIPKSKQPSASARVGGVGLHFSLANSVNRALTDGTSDGTGFIATSTDGVTAIGTSG